MARPKLGYQNRFTTGTVTATSQVTGYEKEHAYNWNTYDFWQPTSAGTNYLTVDNGSAVSVDYFGVAAHNLASYSGSVSIQYSSNGSSWTTVPGSTVTPADNSPIFKAFTAVSARYWRLAFVTTGTAPSIGVAALGAALELVRAAQSGFVLPREARTDRVIDHMSEGGAFLGRSVISQGFEASYTFGIQTLAFVRVSWSAFLDHAQLKPFFFSWNPDYSDAVYCWQQGDPTPPAYDRVNTLSIGLKLKGLR